MNTITIDTHKAIEKLKVHGYTQQQAEGFVDVLADAQVVTTPYLDRKVDELRLDIYKAMLIQTGTIAAIVVGILALFVG